MGPGESQRKQSWQALGALAYLQKRKADRGLEGLPGLDGVGLRLLGVRLKVKITSFRAGEMIAVQIAVSSALEGPCSPWARITRA